MSRMKILTKLISTTEAISSMITEAINKILKVGEDINHLPNKNTENHKTTKIIIKVMQT